jgi:hypothetical protein
MLPDTIPNRAASLVGLAESLAITLLVTKAPSPPSPKNPHPTTWPSWWCVPLGHWDRASGQSVR